MKRIGMKVLQAVLIVVCITLFAAGNVSYFVSRAEAVDKPFYYASSVPGGKVFLDLRPETVNVKFVAGTTLDEVTRLAAKYKSISVKSIGYRTFWELQVPLSKRC